MSRLAEMIKNYFMPLLCLGVIVYPSLHVIMNFLRDDGMSDSDVIGLIISSAGTVVVILTLLLMNDNWAKRDKQHQEHTKIIIRQRRIAEVKDYMIEVAENIRNRNIYKGRLVDEKVWEGLGLLMGYGIILEYKMKGSDEEIMNGNYKFAIHFNFFEPTTEDDYEVQKRIVGMSQEEFKGSIIISRYTNGDTTIIERTNNILYMRNVAESSLPLQFISDDNYSSLLLLLSSLQASKYCDLKDNKRKLKIRYEIIVNRVEEACENEGNEN